MRTCFLILLLITLCSYSAQGQAKQQVEGLIADKDSRQPLAGASVLLKKVSDSSRVISVFTNEKGIFSFLQLQPGDYRITVSYLGYQPLERTLSVGRANTPVNLGTFFLQKGGLTLNTVEIVEKKPAVKMKKDTLEFNAAYFKTRENALMEALLRKLPGVQIARDGTISVNGVAVKRIMVNGKPYFGDNPLLASKNIAAEIIDKIQLINASPEEIPYTGVNNDKSEQVINITIKADKAGKFSGRAGMGYGTEGRFAGNASLNRFADKQQLSFIGGGNNVNDWLDAGQPTPAESAGIARKWEGGLNYNRSLSEKLEMNARYFISSTRSENLRNSARQNLLPDSTYYYNQHAFSVSDATTHNVSLHFAYNIDSMQKLIIMPQLSLNRSNSLQENTYNTLGEHKEVVNQGTLQNTDSRSSPDLSAAFFYERKFKKQGRSLRTDLTIKNSTNRETGYDQANNMFVLPGGDELSDTLDQQNRKTLRNRSAHFRFIYAEPVFKDHVLGACYIYTKQYSLSEKATYNFNASKGLYDHLNDSLSNTFENNAVFHLLYLDLHARKKKLDYGAGLNILLSDINNYNVTQTAALHQQWLNVFPTLFFGYAFTDNKRLGFSYNPQTTPADAAQLWPVPDNSNPLYIQQGNPNLKPAFTHDVHAGYSMLNPQTMRSINFNLNASVVNNKIVNVNRYDSLGRQISKPMNVNGSYRIGVNMANAFPIKRQQTFINTNTAFLLDRDVNYVNGIKGTIQTRIVSQDINYSYLYEQLFDFSFMAKVNYKNVRYAVQGNSNAFWDYNFSLNGNFNLPAGISMGGSMDVLLYAGRPAGYNQQATILNLFISKSLFPGKRGVIKLQAFDILRQHVSVSRNIGDMYVEDVQSKVLQRFFMLGFMYFLK